MSLCRPVIPALWEAGTGGLKVESQPVQFIDEILSQNIKSKRAGEVAQCGGRLWVIHSNIPSHPTPDNGVLNTTSLS